MDTTRLKNDIAVGKLKIISKEAKKSDVWNRFCEVVDTSTLSPSGYVQCKSCKSFFSYNASKTGTSHLIRHKCKSVTECCSIKSFFPENKSAVPASVKETMTSACVRWCAKNMRPYDVVSDDGFLKLADHLIAAGARYGNISAKDLLPHPTTVSRKVAEMASTLREEMKPSITAAVKEARCAMTIDMWTDDYKKISYLTATAHYVDDSWNLHSVVLFTSDFPTAEKKTSENIKRELLRKISKMGLDESIIKNVVFMTDQGANIINALRSVKESTATNTC